MDLHERLKAARKAAGLSLRGAAKQLGLSHNSVNDWETGRSRPTADKFKDVATLYRTDIEWLLGDKKGGNAVVTKNELEEDLIRALRSLSDEDQKTIARMVRGYKSAA